VQSEAERVAPGCDNRVEIRPERPKYVAPSGLQVFNSVTQGRRAPLRFALAPGFHISRRWRCILNNRRLLRQSGFFSHSFYRTRVVNGRNDKQDEKGKES